MTTSQSAPVSPTAWTVIGAVGLAIATAPMLVFVLGGYWRPLSAATSTLVCAGLVTAIVAAGWLAAAARPVPGLGLAVAAAAGTALASGYHWRYPVLLFTATTVVLLMLAGWGRARQRSGRPTAPPATRIPRPLFLAAHLVLIAAASYALTYLVALFSL